MKKTAIFFLLLIIGSKVVSQKKNQVLVNLNGEKVTVAEFKKVYEKNLNAIDNTDAKDVTKNLELYINYKLKVKEAYDLRLDTLSSYKREIETYKNQLIAPYLQDKEYSKKLVKQAYERIRNEVNASHILVKLPKRFSPKDTLEAYNKVFNARKRILSGENFEKVAKEISDDRSVSTNGGNLGYFGAFKMIYDFEDAAYKTKKGEISLPFRTRFGYHIVKNNGFRLSRGEVQVAHILVTDTTIVGKTTIEEVYSKLKKGENFNEFAKKYSNDSSSKNKGGVLRKFGSGSMVKLFEDASFSLNETGELSTPFKTTFGWHIVKLIKKYPVLPFEEIKKELESKIKQSGRGRLSDIAVLNRLKKQYTIYQDSIGKLIFERKDIRGITKDSLQNVLLTINGKKIKQELFVSYIQNRRHLPIQSLFRNFIDQEVMTYYKENLVNTEPDFAFVLKEYEDGLLLFELMQQKIWNKSKDSVLLQKYFEVKKDRYTSKDLSKIRGKVMNDFQTFLEEEWIRDLRTKSTIEINKRALKKIIKYYRKES